MVVESISGDKFGTGSKINVLTAHAHTLSSRKSPKMVSCFQDDHVFTGQGLSYRKETVRLKCAVPTSEKFIVQLLVLHFGHVIWQC